MVSWYVHTITQQHYGSTIAHGFKGRYENERGENQACHYPCSHEPVFQHDPRKQEDKSFVTTEQGRDVCGCQLL